MPKEFKVGESMLSGGLFWLLQLSALSLSGVVSWSPLVDTLDVIVVKWPDKVEPVLTAAIIATSSLVIFLTGLCLRLLGGIFFGGELSMLVQRLRFHRDWLVPSLSSPHPSR